ncbi:type II CAAX endopeptidase family protein [Mucilaginibacter sp.]|uniref:CPBP family intramembrane glutamic endopeptidase n=1 Tax=Mucilaginibacter sp. TaxID=1882438 RepID=UPI0026128DF1|nr:type II CAAX endopeptidase family protein [Mucilaginibacter sp.]MDB5032475.1 family intrarane metalloprotease [Mucilaginibacter sp.]
MLEQVTTTKPSKIVIIAGILIATVFSLVLYTILLRAHLSVLNGVIYTRLIYWAEIVFLWWFAAQFENQPLLIWKEKQSGIKFILLWTVFLFLLILAANLIADITTLLGYHQNKEILRQISRFITGRYFLIAFISITAGVTEEIIFRGYILTRLSLLFKNQYIPIVISALLFSGMHYTYNSPREFVFTFLGGTIMAVHYNRYGNLKPLIIAHTLIDWAANTFLHYFIK